MYTAQMTVTQQHITIHARHGDFGNWCNEPNGLNCFAPLSVFARRVEEIQQELLERKGIHVDHVIMTSDEENEGWWDEVRAMGWVKIDHEKEKTVEDYGEWCVLHSDPSCAQKVMPTMLLKHPGL